MSPGNPSDPSLDLVEGDRVELTVEAPAHGGHCVARLDGRVVFVRHALPGERITAEITERHRGYLRADAVEIHTPSPDRVEPPCPHAHPGGCGGCDLQHVASDAQLRWKAAVVEEQLKRLAGMSYSVRVEPLPPARPHPGVPARLAADSPSVPPAPAGVAGHATDRPAFDSELVGEAGGAAVDGRLLGWRSRVRYAVDAAGRAGLLQHRSHQVVPIERCVIAHPAIQELDLLRRDWPETGALEVVSSTGGDVTVLARAAGGAGLPVDDPAEALGAGRRERIEGPDRVVEVAAGRRWRVPPESFWQVHPAAADTLTAAVLDLLRPAEGEVAWDLYGGAGLFAAALVERTRARTVIVEAAPTGTAAARANLTDLPYLEVIESRVEAALARRLTGPVDLVVLDPPRAGAGARVVRAIAAARPRAVAYVACDPAALARDIATFRGLGWQLADLRAFDLFPMTQHVECVALLEPARS